MPLRSESGNVMPKPFDEHDLCARVWSEYREMPGLNLTIAQAARLFSLDRGRCAAVLQALVERGVLATNGSAFGRADSGRRYA
jgi:hypothetical protein